MSLFISVSLPPLAVSSQFHPRYPILSSSSSSSSLSLSLSVPFIYKLHQFYHYVYTPVSNQSKFKSTTFMASTTKWFSNTGLRLSVGRSKSKPRSRSSNSSTSPMSSSPSETPKPINREDELREVFRRFDGNGDGKISAHELRSYFGSIGENLSYEEAEGVIRDLDSDGDNLLDMEDFMKLMKKEEEEDDDEDLKKAFEMFEWEKGSGCITPKGLQRMLHRLGDDKSFDDCVAMINAFDVDRNGVVDFNEFLQMMA